MRNRTLCACLLLAALPGTIRAAEAPTLEERLRALEERVRALEAENARLKADVAPKPNAPAVAKAAGRETEIKVGGFLQIQAEAGGRGDRRFSDDHDRIFLRRARLNVGGRFLERVEWRTEVELAGTLERTSALRAQLTDAYVAWRRRPLFDVRAGQFKTPFGFEQLSSDLTLATPERTLGSDRLTLGRQLGVQLGGNVLERRFAWLAGAFNGSPANASGNDDDRFLVAARVAGVPVTRRMGERDLRWSLGLNAFTSRDAAVTLAPEFKFDSNPAVAGNDNVFAGRRQGVGADSQLAVGPFELWLEWLESDFRPDDGLPLTAFAARSRAVQATFLTWADRLQLALRWDDFDPNRSTPADATSTWTSGVTWLIRGTDLKLQAHWLDVHGPQPDGNESKAIVRFQLVF